MFNHRLQNLLLLVGSYVFYGWWDWRFLGLIFSLSVVSFICGIIVDRCIEDSGKNKYRKPALLFNIIFALLILCFFKYFNFFVKNFVSLSQWLGLPFDYIPWEVILPVGISFYTFQTMSYTIDVYRGELKATKDVIAFMLYVSFFTQLVAGPIERGKHLLPQILNEREISLDNFISGLQLALWGYCQKMVIADNMAKIVNRIFYSSELSANGIAVLIAVYAFAFQIYGDFAGYTNIARGCARMMGFDLMLNFNLPYFAYNPQDFWRRWHISLSTWLRDYLYIPLGGNRKGWLRAQLNIFITFLLGGLWHGASWTFVVWGAYHAFLLVAYNVVLKIGITEKNIYKTKGKLSCMMFFKILLMFNLVCVGWLLFRSFDMDHFWKLTMFIIHMGSNGVFNGYVVEAVLVMCFILIPFIIFELIIHRYGLEPWQRLSPSFKYAFHLGVVLVILIFGAPDTREFVYFQF